MLYTMNSKVFLNEFIENESDKDILAAQYVIVSTKIRKREEQDNVISAVNQLYPMANVLGRCTEEEQRDEYFKQLDDNLILISRLITGSIEHKFNIIFLCSKKEDKNLHYLDWLAEYIWIKFKYPVYDYQLHSNGICKLLKYDKDKVLAKCNKIIKTLKTEAYNKNLKTETGRKRIMNEFRDMKKKELKKELIKRGVYDANMSRDDMLETLEVFM